MIDHNHASGALERENDVLIFGLKIPKTVAFGVPFFDMKVCYKRA